MAIEIKEGAAVDPSALQALYEHAPWARGRTADGIRTMLAHTDYHFSAWDGPRLIGFARVLTDGIYRATLWDVVVHPDYQGRGVGEELMNRILAHPVLSRVEKFWLNTRDKFGFYQKFGFVRSEQGMFREQPGKNR
ncbi:MAG: GNAT family N-acetyltransferase [Nitrospirae bacterium]|nr:GNAT family N-acetyltransferase [Nitrospirota bacterium]